MVIPFTKQSLKLPRGGKNMHFCKNQPHNVKLLNFLFDLDCHCSLKVTNHPFIYYVALTACIITTKFNKEMNFEQDILFIHLTVGNMPTIKLSHSLRGNRNV